MKRVNLISSLAVVSGLVISLLMVKNSVAQGQPSEDELAIGRDADSFHKPARLALGQLRAIAKSLVYLPAMKRAGIAAYPVAPKAEPIWQGAEVSLLGVGPLRIGMTLAEARAALDLPLVPLGRNFGGECAYYQPETPSQVLGLMVVDNRVIRIDIWPGSTLPTVSGATIGTPEAAILKQYPNQIEVKPNPYTQGKFLTLTPKNPDLALYRLVFETDANDQVIQYRTGQFPAVTWPDGCI